MLHTQGSGKSEEQQACWELAGKTLQKRKTERIGIIWLLIRPWIKGMLAKKSTWLMQGAMRRHTCLVQRICAWKDPGKLTLEAPLIK